MVSGAHVILYSSDASAVAPSCGTFSDLDPWTRTRMADLCPAASGSGGTSR